MSRAGSQTRTRPGSRATTSASGRISSRTVSRRTPNPKGKSRRRRRGKKKGVVIPADQFQKLLQYVSFPSIVIDAKKNERKTITPRDIRDLILRAPGTEQDREPKEREALVCGKDKDGKFLGKPMTRAVQVGDVKICKVLVEFKAAVYTDHLVDAIKLRNYETVKFLLADPKRVKEILHETKEMVVSVTPTLPVLSHAALIGDERLLQLVLEKDLPKSINYQIPAKADSHAGRAPLHMAAQRGRVQSLHTLLMWHSIRLKEEEYLQEGDVPWVSLFAANLRMKDRNGSTPIGIAAELGNLGAVKAILIEGGLMELRRNCETQGSDKALEKFLSQTFAENRGLTPVQWASYRGDYPMVEFLVGQGHVFNVDDVSTPWFPTVVGSTFDPDLRAIMTHEFSEFLLIEVSRSVYRGERTFREIKQRRELIYRYLKAQDGLRESRFCSYISMTVAAYDVCYCDEDHILEDKLAQEARLAKARKKRRQRLEAEAQAELEEKEMADAKAERAAVAEANKRLQETLGKAEAQAVGK